MVDVFGQSLSLVLFGAGALLSVLEAMAPGAHFVVLGVALMTAGLIGLLVPALSSPGVLGLLVLGAGSVALLAYRRLDIYRGSDTGKTRGARGLAGQTGRVTERVTEESGQVELERGGFDATYAARSREGEIEPGRKVVVTDPGGGNVVTVSPLEAGDEIDRELNRHRERESAEE